MREQLRQNLPKERLESALTDVRAEIYLVEAERLRVGRLVSSCDPHSEPAQLEELLHRRQLIESRLEALEAATAGLRARLEQLASGDLSTQELAGRNGRSAAAGDGIR
jgi:hypothetical protein